MGRGGTCHRWAPLVWSIVMQEDQGCACIEYGYARHRAEAPTGTKAPRIGSAKTDSSGRTGRITYTHSMQELSTASSDGRKVCRSPVRSRRR